MSNPNNLDSSILRLRVGQLVDAYPEPSVLGDCDITSYAYFSLSIGLLTLGTCITVAALGATEHIVFSHLGQMWLVGPICICCGMMVAIKSVLYLRRKSLVKMLLRQRALLWSLQELTQQTRGPSSGEVYMTASTLTLPPAYDMIVSQGILESAAEPPPPSYAEAMRLVELEKANQTTSRSDSRDGSADKDVV